MASRAALPAGRQATGAVGQPAPAHLSHLQATAGRVGGSIRHTLIFPLRLTPLDRVLSLGTGPRGEAIAARRWYRDHGRPVTIVIPSYRDATLVAQLVAKHPQHDRRRPRADHRRRRRQRRRSTSRRCARIDGIDVLAGERQRRLRRQRQPRPAGRRPRARRRPAQLRRRAAARLARVPAVRRRPATATSGSSARKLLYPDGRIQFGGTVRNPRAPEWFDHRYRFKPGDWGPADVAGPDARRDRRVHVHHAARCSTRVGLLDEGYGDGLRGRRLLPARVAGGLPGASTSPSAQLYHHESVTRGTERRRARARRRSGCSGSAGRRSSTSARC